MSKARKTKIGCRGEYREAIGLFKWLMDSPGWRKDEAKSKKVRRPMKHPARRPNVFRYWEASTSAKHGSVQIPATR